MPHRNLEEFGFCDKCPITTDKERNKEFVLSVPRMSGVYLIMADREIDRVRGASDILYIGRSHNLQKRMKQLLKDFLPSDFVSYWGKHTAREALKVILTETDTKLAIRYKASNNYKKEESDLLQLFYKNHIETPALNGQRK